MTSKTFCKFPWIQCEHVQWNVLSLSPALLSFLAPFDVVVSYQVSGRIRLHFYLSIFLYWFLFLLLKHYCWSLHVIWAWSLPLLLSNDFLWGINLGSHWWPSNHLTTISLSPTTASSWPNQLAGIEMQPLLVKHWEDISQISSSGLPDVHRLIIEFPELSFPSLPPP